MSMLDKINIEGLSQREAVLEHLVKFGNITSFEAIKKYGITRLSSIIYLLRRQGYIIKSTKILVDNRFGSKSPIVIYELVEY